MITARLAGKLADTVKELQIMSGQLCNNGI